MAVQDDVAVLNSAQLMKRWSTRTKPTPAAVLEVLTNIQRFARFVPRRGSPEAAWWLSRLAPP